MRNTQEQTAYILQQKKQKESIHIKRRKRLMFSAAAMAIIVMGTVFVLQHMTNLSNPAVVDEDPKNTVAPTESAVLRSTKDKIIEQQVYGVVNLCARPSEEIQAIAMRVGVSNSYGSTYDCFEDDQYIYVFSEGGAIAGVMASYLIDNPGEYDPAINMNWVRLSENEAVTLARAAVLKFCDSYTEETSESYTVSARGENSDVPHYPDWRVTFTEQVVSGIRRNTITVEIDMLGNVAAVFFGSRSDVTDEELENNEYISEDAAISLALNHFAQENREVDLEHFTVTTAMVEHDGSVVWTMRFEEIENSDGGYKNSWKQVYWTVINATTGEWISSDVTR